MDTSTRDILYNKRSLTLADVEKDSFFIRKDTKFLSRVEKLGEILSALDDQWRVLEVDGIRDQAYHSIYFDTTDMRCYREHHDERKNRKKFRFRKYENGVTFFEVKTKTNKGITAKQRMRVSEMKIDKQVGSFLEINSDYRSEELKQSLGVEYNRITLFNDKTKEKITIDTNVRVFDEDSEKIYKNILILELKQDYFNRYLLTRRLMQELQMIPSSLSKYCIGIMQCKPGIKANRFKQKNRLLEKLEKVS